MGEQGLIRGCHAVGAAAIAAGCRGYFGYPITPQSEIPEYMSARLFDVGGVFIQAESELGATSMLLGAAGTGARAMTSSSGPGIALMQENLSAMVSEELPAVLVDMARGGPGGGCILPAQSDYMLTTRGGGQGDTHFIVLTPASCQELADMTYEAFDLADKYRNPVIVLGDGVLAEMMEKVTIPDDRGPETDPKLWAADGKRSEGVVRGPNYINHGRGDPYVNEAFNRKLHEKFAEMQKNELRYEEYLTEDADLILVSYGTSARVSKLAVKKARAEGKKVGLFRLKAVWPFPYARLRELAQRTKRFLAVEMSCGQLVEDVMWACDAFAKVGHYGRQGGVVISDIDVTGEIKRIYEEEGI